MDADTAAWMALAWRSALPTAEQWRIAAGPGPDPGAFPADVLAREAADLEELRRLGARVLTAVDPDYPASLRGEAAPVVLQVAGPTALLDDERADVYTRVRGAKGEQLHDCLESGGCAVLVLAKGLLKARTLLRALHEPLEHGRLVIVSAEPPRAAWGPSREPRRDQLARSLRGARPRGPGPQPTST